MAARERKPRCEYCQKPIKGKAIRKVVVGQAHIFCSELCWALFRYGVPLEEVYLDWS